MRLPEQQRKRQRCVVPRATGRPAGKEWRPLSCTLQHDEQKVRVWCRAAYARAEPSRDARNASTAVVCSPTCTKLDHAVMAWVLVPAVVSKQVQCEGRGRSGWDGPLAIVDGCTDAIFGVQLALHAPSITTRNRSNQGM